MRTMLAKNLNGREQTYKAQIHEQKEKVADLTALLKEANAEIAALKEEVARLKAGSR